MEITEVLEKICDAGAKAVQRYCHVSGEGPNSMPELFVASYIFDHLGDELTFTLETSARNLIEWHGSVQDALLARRETNRWRVDLVLYEGDTPKSEMNMYAIIEVKRGWFSDELTNGGRSDLDKLRVILTHLAGCRFGVMAASMAGDEREKKKDRASSRGDIWIERHISLPASLPKDHYFCIWLLEVGKGSLTVPP